MTTAAIVLLGLFALLMLLGTPLGVALGLAGAAVILMQDLGEMAIPTSLYTGIAKYPLLAIPLFILAGTIFERAGVAARLVRFVSILIGSWRGSLGVVAVLVAMVMGGISGSGPADAAAVATVMLPAMTRAGYPPAFSASIIAAAGATAILIPPSVAFIIYSVLVPQATVPALFAAGLFPGILAGLALILPIVFIARRYGFGGRREDEEKIGVLRAAREAIWGLLAPVIILGGMRAGLFTPTEAAVAAVTYGLLVGLFIHRSLTLRDLGNVFMEAAEMSAVVLLIIGLASIFAWAGSTLGAFDVLAQSIVSLEAPPWMVLILINLLLMGAGMFLDAVSIYLILLPLLMPLVTAYQWDPVWFGVVMTMNLAVGQFTPPLAVNLMVTCAVAGVPIEKTVRWVIWLVLAMLSALVLVAIFPSIALWLPRSLGY
ncbi:TRAP transporter large permease [Telmatospirillum sp. J64-1]|uniref:TRAP transporter large permease n=1 Tax=Telmatospirillum sp. J64-1 TaxID=2502183 RepID=UPI00115E2584|nr:TRAP transporter large permease [Telmatospirillum sp. J64-1]